MHLELAALMQRARWWSGWCQLQGYRGWQATVETLYPAQCVWCGIALRSTRNWLLCQDCRSELHRSNVQRCRRCGEALRRNFVRSIHQAPDLVSGRLTLCDEEGCAACREKKLPYTQVIVAGLYRGKLRQSVILAKQAEHAAIAPVLGRLIVNALRKQDSLWLPDVVTYVPTFWLKRAMRGHCSPELISETVASRLHRRHLNALQCQRATSKQGTLSVAARRKNVRNAFSLRPTVELKNQRVLLIDDVMTTGATVAAAARVLRKAGASEVRVAVAARGG